MCHGMQISPHEYFFIYLDDYARFVDESDIFTLVGVSLVFPENCYSYNSSLMVLSGSNYNREDCYYMCTVSVNPLLHSDVVVAP